MNLKYIVQRIRKNPQFVKAVEELKMSGARVDMSGLPGSRSAFWAKALTGRWRPVLMICNDEARARDMLHDFKSLTENVFYYPPRQPVLYNDMAHSPDAERERINTLSRLVKGDAYMIVAAAEALFFPVMTPDRFIKNTLIIETGESPGLRHVIEGLLAAGYEREYMAEGPGQFSLRGGILDIFPVSGAAPYRLEFFGDAVDSIRLLDIHTQRSVEKVKRIKVLPCRELLTGPGEIREIQKNIDEDLEATIKRLQCSGLRDEALNLKEYIAGAKDALQANNSTRLLSNYWMYGCETADIFAYMGQKGLIVLNDPVRVDEGIKKYYGDFIGHYGDRLERGNALLRQRQKIFDPSRGRLLPDEIPQVGIMDILEGESAAYRFFTRGIEPFHGRLPSAVKEIMRYRSDGYLVLVLSGSAMRLKMLQEELNRADIFPVMAKDDNKENYPAGTVILGYGTIKEGFVFPDEKLAVFSDEDVFGTMKRRQKTLKQKRKKGIDIFTELNVDDYVVHENQGIGIYRGIKELKVEGIKRDYLEIEYKNGDMLYLPTYQSHLIQKYVGAEGKRVRISKMGGREWTRTKAGVKKAIEGMARELLRLYAVREETVGHAFEKDTPWQRQFDDLFPFEETSDQLKSIEETKRDMERTRPMDRLLCGDVGYGKTEVAMRAAFKAVMDGKQVAMLVPTTVLAQQHYNTFRQRMEQFPIGIEMISRFRTFARQQEILRLLKEGNIDILIGTHRLLQQDVLFKDLGLLIIDEEQRFGVDHKEQVKKLRKDVDVLTLTATPIPRTLHMSMAGIRDMSVILDPPKDRVPIETFILEENDELIREAIQKELNRNGQVYFVHNRVNSIAKTAARLRDIVPEASLCIAHGQMDENALEKVMVDFVERKYDILLCTTIIENGLDMPNVNTIIVTDADRLGLSQMYQLKGRVGRSNRVAYAYFTYKKDKVLTEAAEKRLRAIREFTEFGAGFKIALRDLEIRGAGNILGHEQHGHMMTVGYDMYCKLLDETINELKGRPVEQKVETYLDFKVDAYIPEGYIPDGSQRVKVYRRIAAIETVTDYSDVYEELNDRFGRPADPVTNLMLISYIKQRCRELGIQAVLQKDNYIRVQFAERTPVKHSALVAFCNEYAGSVKVRHTKALSFVFRTGAANSHGLLNLVKEFLEKIICFNNEQSAI